MPVEVKEQRYVRFMERQQAISAKRLKRKVGTRQQVIIDKVENGIAVGRTRGDAPEIDGVVHVSARRPLKVGGGRGGGGVGLPPWWIKMDVGLRRRAGAGREGKSRVNVKIERADAYDLYGQAVGSDRLPRGRKP